MSNHPYLIDEAVAFPTLDDSELTMLEELGTRRAVATMPSRVLCKEILPKEELLKR